MLTKGYATVPHRTPKIWPSVMLALLVLVGGAAPALAQNYTLSPPPFLTILDDSGAIVVGGCVWTYAAGTTTAIATYANNSGTLNTNPVVADNMGRFTIYLLAGTTYKFVYENVPCAVSPPTHGAVLRTADNIGAVPPTAGNLDITGLAGEALTAGQVAYLSDGSGGKTAGSWYKADNTNTYSSTLPPLGMVPVSIANGGTGTIRIAGSVTGLAGLVVGGPYYVGTAGALTATQPTNGRRVGNADTTASLVLVASPLGFSPAASTITTTGNITALPLPASFSDHFTVYMNNATLATIQGITAGTLGQRLTVFSIGSGEVDFTNLDAAAAVGNKLLNFVQTGITPLAAGGGSAEFVYDTSSRWRLVSHQQGDWITWAPTFSTNSAATWTAITNVTSKYLIVNRKLTVSFEFDSSSVSATTATELRATLPASLVVASRTFGLLRVSDNAAASVTGVFLSNVSDAFFRVFRDLTLSANWTTSVTSTSMQGTFELAVQ